MYKPRDRYAERNGIGMTLVKIKLEDTIPEPDSIEALGCFLIDYPRSICNSISEENFRYSSPPKLKNKRR
ncbi:hypothetical protein X975_11703, partial [Stegodyphus mimosarum]